MTVHPMVQFNSLPSSSTDRVYYLRVSLPNMPKLSNLRSILGNPVQFVNQYCPNLLQKIKEVAKFIFMTSLSLFLYWTNPSLFAMGFITGIIYDDQVREMIKKIQIIWMTQTWKSCIFVVASFLSLPVTLAAGSFIWGAHLGKKLAQDTKKNLISHEDEKQQTPLVDATC